MPCMIKYFCILAVWLLAESYLRHLFRQLQKKQVGP